MRGGELMAKSDAGVAERFRVGIECCCGQLAASDGARSLTRLRTWCAAAAKQLFVAVSCRRSAPSQRETSAIRKPTCEASRSSSPVNEKEGARGQL